MSEWITIAIPFYRGVDYLSEAVESVLAQSESGWRLIVRDDLGDPREASDVTERLRTYHDPRIELHRNHDTLGMVRNWNLCLDEAPTDLVTLLHADDRLQPGYVAQMRSLTAAHPEAAAIFCDAAIIGPDGRSRFSLADSVKRRLVPRGPDPFLLEGEPALGALARADFVMCPTLCFRKSVLDGRRFDARWRQVQDLDFLTRLLMDGETLVGTRQAAYDYRRHPGNATAAQSDTLLRFEEEVQLLDELARRCSERGWHTASRTAERKTIVKLHLVSQILGDSMRLRGGTALRKLRFLRRL